MGGVLGHSSLCVLLPLLPLLPLLVVVVLGGDGGERDRQTEWVGREDSVYVWWEGVGWEGGGGVCGGPAHPARAVGGAGADGDGGGGEHVLRRSAA